MRHAGGAQAVEAFRAKFHREPSGVAFSPGRVNIIGEHTDYNDGFVLPAAVNLATFIAFAPRADARVRIYSDMTGEEAEFEVKAAEKERLAFWARYAWGTGMSLAEKGAPITGFDGYATTSVPQGGGLSSSASFEVALALAYLGDRAGEVAKTDLVHICRRAENAFVGVNCGVMDQFACIFGSEGHALMLDCRSLEHKNVLFPENAALVVADTTVRHALGETGYHRRQEECLEAVAALQSAGENVKALRDATVSMLKRNAGALGDVLYRRARHVVSENARVQEAAEAMWEGDVGALGRLMHESHASLRDDYEVSCAELDRMAECAEGLSGHYGTRMVGGGFGGCTVSLVEKARAKEFAGALEGRYRQATGLEPALHIVVPGRGAGLVGIENVNREV